MPYWLRYGNIIGQFVEENLLNGRCVLCRKLRGNPGVQIMADLPPSRVGAPNPPFTFTGIDFFGPIITKAAYRRSRRNKRYGALFTCFQTRAVHLEVAQSLSTDDIFEIHFKKVKTRNNVLRSRKKFRRSQKRIAQPG